MALGVLKVSPEEMQAMAATLSGYVRTMDECFRTIKNTMATSSVYWVGDAGNAHRALYEEQVEYTEQIVARYTEHVKDLNTMAGVYAEAEQTAQTAAEELPEITF